MLGGNRLSARHSCREVTPGLWCMTDNTEKSTGLNSNRAMFSVKRPIIVSAARRALYPTNDSSAVRSSESLIVRQTASE